MLRPHIFKVRIAVTGIPQIQSPGNMPQRIQHQDCHEYKFPETSLTVNTRFLFLLSLSLHYLSFEHSIYVPYFLCQTAIGTDMQEYLMQSVADSFPHKIHQNSQYKYYHNNKYRPQQQRQYTVDLLHTKPLLPGIAHTQISCSRYTPSV